MAEIVLLFGHGFGGRPSERIMARLGMPVGHGAILRHLKRTLQPLAPRHSPRIVGIDEWAWTKGMHFGTVIIDLERREVVDLLPDRAASSVAKWFKDHPGAELISRDRVGSTQTAPVAAHENGVHWFGAPIDRCCSLDPCTL